MRKILVGVFMLAVACAPLSIAWGQSAQQTGRYQVIPQQGDLPLFVDTITGRVWLLMKSQGNEPGSQCRGLSVCFHEIDRLRRTDQGWQSEIYPPKR